MSGDALERRIVRLEERIGELAPRPGGPPETGDPDATGTVPPRDWTEIAKAVGPLVSGLVIVVVGYFLTDSVNQALQERQLQVSNVREMRELLLALGNPTATLAELESTALTVSAFGGFALGPLVNLLDRGSETQVLAAKDGLRAVGIVEPEAACTELSRVMGNRTRLFRWETHLWAIRLTGELGCGKADETLDAYQALLEESLDAPGLTPYADTVRQTPPLQKAHVESLLEAVVESRDLLQQATAGGSTP